MRIRTSVMALFLALALPAVAPAGPIHVVQFGGEPDDGDGSFSPGGASGYDWLDRAWVDGLYFGSPLTICNDFGWCDELQLSLRWDVGPLVDFDPWPNPDAPPGAGTYTYGGGTLALDGYWDLAVGGPYVEPDIFVADITSLVITLTHEGSYGLVGDTIATLGDGRFAPSLAHLLGVSMRTVGGEYGISTDGARVVNGSGSGLGDNYGIGLEVQVPEPAAVLLTALGALGFALRRRRSSII